MHCSFSVRMKRSATPLHSGSPTYDGEMVHPSTLHLVDPGVGDVLWSPVTPDGQAPRHILAEPSERVTDPLAQRLERRPSITDLRHVPADYFSEMVIDRAEEPAPAVLLGVEPGAIRPTHHVGPVRDDRAVVGRVAIRGAQPTRRQ